MVSHPRQTADPGRSSKKVGAQTVSKLKTHRYTESQVLFGLREAWQNFTGVDDEFDADTRIVAFMKSDGSWDDIDLADLFRGIECFFGFRCPDKEWTDFFGFDIAERSPAEWEQSVVPNLTFGSLSRFIAERTPALASFDPISVLGRPCALAGVFTGIQVVAGNIAGSELRFAPSTQIIDVLRGHHLDAFWTELRWRTEHATPELPAFWRGVTGVTGCLGIVGVIAVFFVTWLSKVATLIIPTVLMAFMSYVIASAYKRFANPLPSHIVTFRDLSNVIAARRP